MRTSDFEYEMPPELVAHEPIEERDGCRLLVMDRATGAVEDRIFRDILDYVEPGDLFVANDTRVAPRLLEGETRDGACAVGVILADEIRGGGDPHSSVWEVTLRPQGAMPAGGTVDFRDAEGKVVLSAEVSADAGREKRVAALASEGRSIGDAVRIVGHTPLPPYAAGNPGDEVMYQTVYSRNEGSSASPTAGLHFTPELIRALRERGAEWETVELEIGIGTYQPVDEGDPGDHSIHSEVYTVPDATAEAVARAKARGSRVIAVGTTSVRSLESAWDPRAERVTPREREATSLFLLPGSEFHVVDALITNLHEPRSTLLMLVSAFSSRENVLAAYEHAVALGYRFLAFGDAMFIH